MIFKDSAFLVDFFHVIFKDTSAGSSVVESVFRTLNMFLHKEKRFVLNRIPFAWTYDWSLDFLHLLSFMTYCLFEDFFFLVLNLLILCKTISIQEEIAKFIKVKRRFLFLIFVSSASPEVQLWFWVRRVLSASIFFFKMTAIYWVASLFVYSVGFIL